MILVYERKKTDDAVWSNQIGLMMSNCWRFWSNKLDQSEGVKVQEAPIPKCLDAQGNFNWKLRFETILLVNFRCTLSILSIKYLWAGFHTVELYYNNGRTDEYKLWTFYEQNRAF